MITTCAQAAESGKWQACLDTCCTDSHSVEKYLCLVHKEEQMILSLAIFLAQQNFLDLNWKGSAGSVPGLSEISANFIPLHHLTLANILLSFLPFCNTVRGLLTGKCRWHSYTNELQSWNYSFESLHITYTGTFLWLPMCITTMFFF